MPTRVTRSSAGAPPLPARPAPNAAMIQSFFCREGEPVPAEEAGDLFREGMPRVGRATGKAEREWLREALDVLSRAGS
ncbi:hypothetical protein HCJ76_35485 [Streptomyces sp. MC1]|uniref:hypothetical protein n=1 Tax=Streptomyces sp. MC1 TaxID=295105 RepID=UPI0018CAD6B5|nr:hypothetical protein [Streptomyces sp. MC1]MBG7703225.1 hypothetical protein [Streptomyces sp. MC1]